ncbi:MAG: hypothetical protein IJJ13_09655 [Lachnospiraceae bacterium]|nr:hypothetical protein [Lachnospiraceae bacterium]
MLKKIGNVLFHNLGLKIVALVASIILWFVIININDPEITRNFSSAVVIENQEALEAQGKTFEVVGGNTAYFTVRAKRSVMKNLSESDFRATADMVNLQDSNKVPINVTALRYNGQLEITKITKYLDIATEDLQSGQYIISAEWTGEPAKGYVVQNLTVTPNVLKVSGPESIVSTIDRVVATVSVNNITSDISDSVIPQLYDKDGRVMDTTRLNLNLSSVVVRAEISSVKEVGISVEAGGTPAEGYEVTKIMYSPETIKVMGDTATLNALSTVTIPPEVLDVTDATEDVSVVIDITAYLPEGVSLVDAKQKDIDLVAVIDPLPEEEQEQTGEE